MANARDVAGVGTGETAQEIGAVLSGMVVSRRTAATVGAALNGAPNACSEPRAARVRSEAQREGGSPHYEGSVALDFCDLRDGVPVELVNAWHVRAMAANVEYAASLHGTRAPIQLVPANARETLKEGPLQLAQIKLNPDDADSIDRLLTSIYGYLPSLYALRDAGEAQLAVLRGKPRTVYGARRGHIQVMA